MELAMSLKYITYQDRKQLVKFLELPISAMEVSGRLYLRLIELETREDRLTEENGEPAGLIADLRAIVAKGLSYQQKMEDLLSNADGEGRMVADRSIVIPNQYSEAVKGSPTVTMINGQLMPVGSEQSALANLIAKCKKDVNRILNSYQRSTEQVYGSYSEYGGEIIQG
jgi:hypothetical protein